MSFDDACSDSDSLSSSNSVAIAPSPKTAIAPDVIPDQAIPPASALAQSSSESVADAIATAKPKRTSLEIFNMNVGFLGIQFGWGLQMANMSAIFEHLGAEAHQIPVLWLAAPLTGLLIQPIIGNLSDYTWTPLGEDGLIS